MASHSGHRLASNFPNQLSLNASENLTSASITMKLRLRPAPALLAVCLLTTALPARAAHWPAWRGAKADGISTEKNLPVKWSKDENVRWRSEERRVGKECVP